MQKRGISPLIANILLLIFVVTLAVLIISFFRKTSETSLSKSDELLIMNRFCDDVSFSIKEASCDDNFIYVKISNEGRVDLKNSLSLLLDTTDGEREIVPFLVNSEVKILEERTLKALRLNKDGNNVQITQLSAVPKTEIDNEVNYCYDLIETIKMEGCN